MTRVLVIDSYDSFVYNLVQYLGELGADPIVVRNDQLSVDDAVAADVDGSSSCLPLQVEYLLLKFIAHPGRPRGAAAAEFSSMFQASSMKVDEQSP